MEQTKCFAAIDLNAGCPARKVTETGAGAALINDPQRIHDIIVAMRKVVQLPITVKTRLGPVPDKVMVCETLAAVESAGAVAMAVHGRFTSQARRGDVSLPLIGEVKRRAKIPIIGNGDVHAPYTAWQMVAETGVDAVMLARAAIGNPWVLTEIRDMFAAKEKPKLLPSTNVRPSRDLLLIQGALNAHLALLRAHLQVLQEKYGFVEDIEAAMVTSFRCHLFRYLHSLNGASDLRGKLSTLNTLGDIRKAISECLASEAAHRATPKRVWVPDGGGTCRGGPTVCSGGDKPHPKKKKKK